MAWATYTQELGNKDIVKLGDGLLTVNTTLGGAFTGAIDVYKRQPGGLRGV